MWQTSQLLCQGHLGPVRPVAWGQRRPGQERVPLGAWGCPSAPGPSRPGLHTMAACTHRSPLGCLVWAGTQHRPRLSGPAPRFLRRLPLRHRPKCCLGNLHITSPPPRHLAPLGPPAPLGPQGPGVQPICSEGTPRGGQGEARGLGASSSSCRLGCGPPHTAQSLPAPGWPGLLLPGSLGPEGPNGQVFPRGGCTGGTRSRKHG